MIVYFTGTGNSRYIAQALADALQDELIDSGNYLKQGVELELHSDRPWVFVAPTYCWRLPRAFEDLLRRGRFTGACEAYFVMTCGSDTGNAVHYLRKLCRAKNWTFMGLQPIVMPENYIAMFEVPDRQTGDKLVRIGGKFARKAAKRILEGASFKPVPVSLTGRVCSGPVNPGFYRMFVRDTAFYATEACIGCGKCAESCVLNNIRLAEGKPQWQGNCTHCMACICGCPAEAIEYGEKSRGKRRYLCPPYCAD